MRIADELPDMMGYVVEGDGESTRFLITQEGARLSATSGNNLMGLRSGATPVSVINAVIDLDFAHAASAAGIAYDDVVELS